MQDLNCILFVAAILTFIWSYSYMEVVIIIEMEKLKR